MLGSVHQRVTQQSDAITQMARLKSLQILRTSYKNPEKGYLCSSRGQEWTHFFTFTKIHPCAQEIQVLIFCLVTVGLYSFKYWEKINYLTLTKLLKSKILTPQDYLLVL